MKPTFKHLLRAAAAVCFAAALAPPAQAQRDPGRDRERDLRERELQEQELREANARELRRRAIEEELGKPARRELRKPSVQVADDFLRLQVVNDDLAQAVSRGGAPDFRFVAKSASEIRKLGGRLKLGLMLPEPKGGSRYSLVGVVEDVGQLKALLAALDKLIVGFARNPYFKEMKVFNVELSSQAGRDLEEIIALSERIKKSSEKLNKAAQKTQ